MQRQTCSQWSATDSENHSVDLFAISTSPNSFGLFFFFKYIYIFVKQLFLSLSGHDRIKTLLADELSAHVLCCTAEINQVLCPVP